MGRILASMIVVATSLSLATAQQGDHEKHHGAEQPKEAKMGSMPMMESMMMEMHQRHVSEHNQWTVTDDAVFALQGQQLVKYDADLKRVKQVDLPKPKSEGSGESSAHAEHHVSEEKEESPPDSQAGKMKMTQQMMSKLHNALARKIEATSDAVFVAQGKMLLKYDHDLELQAQSEPAEGKSGMKCPMCEQMMKHEE